MYRTSVVCSVKHFTCYIEEELDMKSILYDVQLLATHTLSAKCPTLNCDSRVRFERANFADRSEILESTHLCYHEVISVVITNCCRNGKKSRHGVMAYVSRSWLGIFHKVSVVSYKMFAMVVACKKENGRETIVDQRNLDIGKVADAVVQTEYVYEELSTKIRSVNLLKFRERAVFPKCETSEGLCAKARDFKLMCSIDYNNYLEGTRYF